MERIIIDTDLGVDDAVGIILAAHKEEIKIEALTIVSSIAGVEEETQNAFKVLRECKKDDIPVYRGASHPLEREINKVANYKEQDTKLFDRYEKVERQSEKEVAVDYMIRMAKENPGELTIVAMGPLTNVAIAIQKDAEFANNIKRLIINGGAEFGGNCSPVAEFNFWGDPHAARNVFKGGFKDIVMIGLDATRQIQYTEVERDALNKQDLAITQFMYDVTEKRVDLSEEELRKTRGTMDGALAIAYIVDENVMTVKPCHVSVETKGLAIGQSIIDPNGLWSKKVCNCVVAEDVDNERFKTILESAFI